VSGPRERAHDPRPQVVVTRFECPGLYALLLVKLLHHRVRPQVRAVAPGYLGGTTLVRWRTRTLLSLSLWRDLDGVYDMGQARRHVLAARVPSRLGVRTSCDVYARSGEWRRVMFGVPSPEGRGRPSAGGRTGEDDLQGAGAVHALDAVEFDVAGGRRPGNPRQRP
jgi:hypothetical protein